MFFHIGGKGSEQLLPRRVTDCLLATDSRTLVNIGWIEKQSFNYCILYLMVVVCSAIVLKK